MARLEATSILDAINKIIAAKYPDIKSYINYAPIDFKRPSFLYQQVRVTRTPATRWTQKITLYFTVTIFVPVDDYDHMDTVDLLKKQFDVMDALSGGAIFVGDRAVQITTISGDQDLDAAAVDVAITYFDDRPDDSAQHEADKMQDIKITYYVNNEVV